MHQSDSKTSEDVQVEHIPATGSAAAAPRLNGRNVLYILAIAMGMVAGGAINGMIATTLAQPSFQTYFNLTGSNSTALIGATNGTFYAGGFCGVFFGAWCADRFGRRNAMALNCVLSTIWCALLAGSVNMKMFITIRFFSGFGASQFVTLTPLYQSEISPPHLRGMMVGMTGMGNMVGYEIASWSGVGFFFLPGSKIQWRMPFVILGGLCLILLALLPFIPESPRWLLTQGRQAEAEAVIRQIHTHKSDPGHLFAELELTQMERQIQEEKEMSVGYLEMFTDKKWRRRSLLCCLVGLLGQSTGCLVINNYGPYFYSVLGMDSLQQLFLSAGFISCSFAFALISIFIVDKVGRVKLMVFGSFAQVACLCIETAIVATNPNATNRGSDIAGIFTFYLYVAVYAVSWDCTQFTYVAEIMPTHLRAKGVTLAIGTLYLCDVAYLTGTLYAFTRIGWKYFLVFICIAPPLAIALLLYAPETKGRTLEEIGGLFGDHVVVESLDTLGAKWDETHENKTDREAS